MRWQSGTDFRGSRFGGWLLGTCLVFLGPLLARAQVIDCNPGNLFTGSLRIRPAVGCVPLTVQASTGGEAGVRNVRYQYEFNNGPYKPSDVSFDSVYTFKRPGEYQILQLSEKDGNLRRACGRVMVYDTVAPAFVLTSCRNQVSISVPNPARYQFHGYIVRWGDGSRDSLGAPPQNLSHTYADNQPRTITVEGVYRFGCPRPTSQVFRPAEGASTATIEGVDAATAQSLRVRVRNPEQFRLRLEQRQPDGSYRRLPNSVAGSSAAVTVAGNPAEPACFRLVLADTCVLAEPRPTFCYDPPPPPPIPQAEPGVYMPDAFTPNGDGINDELRPLGVAGATIRFEVYDRWGRVLFVSEDAGRGWDGSSAGQPVATGLYAYRLVVTWPGGKRLSVPGSVLLVR